MALGALPPLRRNLIMNEKARIGSPPSRVWGCPTTAMWVYRLGAEKAKQRKVSCEPE